MLLALANLRLGARSMRSGLALAAMACAGISHAVTVSSFPFTVPIGVSQISVAIQGGGGGGGGSDSGPGADGGNVVLYTAVMRVSAGDVINRTVGGGGSGGKVSAAVHCASAGAGGSGNPSGGHGGEAGCVNQSGGGGGGGGASSLTRNNVVVLLAGGAGGGGGASFVGSPPGGSGSVPTTMTTSSSCAPGGGGGAGATGGSSTDGGGGGGGGGGFSSAGGGAFGEDGNGNGHIATGGGAGTSCSSTQALLFVSGPTGSSAGGAGAGAANDSVVGGNGSSGFVTVDFTAPPSQPPTVNKAFSPAAIATGDTSTLTITLTNPNAVTVGNAAFTDTYPFKLINATSPAGTTTCAGGTVTATAGGSSLTLSGATMPASGSCTVTVQVTSTTAGSFTNSLGSGAVTSASGSNAAAASATLIVSGRFVTGSVFLDNGAGGGTANDGIRNGTEAPQSGITITLGNCSGIPFSSGITDGTGNFSLAVPTDTASGAPLCVAQTNPGGRVSTGASIGSAALPNGTATTVSGTNYTYTRAGTPDTIAFVFNGIGHSNLSFGDVDPNTFAVDGARTGIAGNTVSYPHTFTAQSDGVVRFDIASAVAHPVLGGWDRKIFADPGCKATQQAGTTLLFPPSTLTVVTAGQVVCIIVQEFIPATAINGYTNTVKVRAIFSYNNATPPLAREILTVTELTAASAGAGELKIEVRNFTQSGAFTVNNKARSGDVLEYRLAYTNNGVSPITGVMLNTTTPNYTTFVSAVSGAAPAAMINCTKTTPASALPVACASTQASGGTGPVSWHFDGTLNPGATGTVLLQVKVN